MSKKPSITVTGYRDQRLIVSFRARIIHIRFRVHGGGSCVFDVEHQPGLAYFNYRQLKMTDRDVKDIHLQRTKRPLSNAGLIFTTK